MQIHNTAFIAPGAIVRGNVILGEDTSVWYHAVIRGDRDFIAVGRGSNIQDNCVVHVDEGNPVVIGENVTVGHSAVLHGCRIGNNTLIGMGAIIMDGCVIGENCIVGAGALVTQNTVIPEHSLVVGSPARVKRQVTAEETEASLKNARLYVEEAAKAREESSGHGNDAK